MESVIYLCPLEGPNLTLEYQEKICRKICKKIYNLDDFIIVKDTEKDKPELRKLWFCKEKYKNIYMYDLFSLGESYEEIYDKIENRPCNLVSLIYPYETKNDGASDIYLRHMGIFLSLEIAKRWKAVEE